MSVVELEVSVPSNWRGNFHPDRSLELTEHSLAAFNRFLDLYQVLTEQVDVRHVNLENLGLETIVEFRDDVGVPSGNFLAPHRLGRIAGSEPTPPEHLLSVIDRAVMDELNDPPFNLVRRLYLRAARFADTGEYEAAIVTLQSSAERMVFALHTLVLVDQNVAAAEIERRLPGTFSAALKRLPALFGGDWSLAGQGAVARYWNDLYKVRNRITHLGVTPYRDEVPDAFEAYEGFRAHVYDRTLAARSKYPRTALAVHGGIGINKAGALDRHMQSVLDDIHLRGEDHSFWLPVDKR